MNCPRCGVSSHADRSTCVACSWQLSRPFTTGVIELLPEPVVDSRDAGARIQTAVDAFVLTSPTSLERPQRPQRPLARRLGRRSWHRRREPPLDGNAIAVLPEEARWEAPSRLEVIEMPLVQSSFDFTAEEDAETLLALRRIAPLEARLQAGLVDAGLILGASAAFFALFALLGGGLSLGRRDLLIYFLVAFSLASLYLGLFTLLGGRTPGMRASGLTVLTFEGQPLTPQHALWRAFGYIVSTGALLLGFLWAAVDERQLTWHDLISRTFLTDRSSS